MTEDRKQEATHITSNPRSGKLGTINDDDDNDDDDYDDDDDDDTYLSLAKISAQKCSA